MPFACDDSISFRGSAHEIRRQNAGTGGIATHDASAIEQSLQLALRSRV
jgi:hypothetical protein